MASITSMFSRRAYSAATTVSRTIAAPSPRFFSSVSVLRNANSSSTSTSTSSSPSPSAVPSLDQLLPGAGPSKSTPSTPVKDSSASTPQPTTTTSSADFFSGLLGHLTPTTPLPQETTPGAWWSHRFSKSNLASHPVGTPFSGRSVPVKANNVAVAYRRLSGVLGRNKVKKELRLGEFWEKPCQKRRRLESERHRRRFQELIRKKVQLVQTIRNRS